MVSPPNKQPLGFINQGLASTPHHDEKKDKFGITSIGVGSSISCGFANNVAVQKPEKSDQVQ